MRRPTLGRAAALTAVAMILCTQAAWADDISNNLDGTVDAVAEVMALNSGGPNGTTQLYVVPQGGDGKPGCNLTGSTTLVVSVASSNAGVATVAPTSVTFTSCGTTAVLTVTPVATGSTTISVSQTSNTTGASFSLAAATFTVNVAPPANTAPSVSVTGVDPGAIYEIGSVPAAECSVIDPEDGNTSFPATPSAITGPLSIHGLGDQTASCSYTDGGGLTASASITYAIVDTGIPTMTFVSRLPVPNGAGWNNTDVVVTWSCADTGGSGVVAATVSDSVSIEGADQSAVGTCTDHAGNTASDTQTGISVDKTAPAISDQGVSSGTLGTNDWYTTSVVNEFIASDGLSGVVGTNPALVSTGSAEGTGITVNSGDFSDAADNIVAGIDSAPFKIDLSDPTDVAFSGLLSGSYVFGSVPAEPTCTASDAISGLAGCVVTGYSTLVGIHTLTATATDNAGRTATASTTYTVVAWTLKGFYQPVDMSGVVNTVKAGSTVPLKFEAFAGPTELIDTGIVSALVKAATCTTGLPEDTIEVTATGSTSLRYDATAGQFIYNWQTPKLPGRCYTVTLTTLDGSALSALFKLK